MKKAVILAGGLGSRMLPVTEHIPKALVPISNTPIILKQLRQLEVNDFEEVIILTGHLHEQIINYLSIFTFKFKLKVLYSPVNFSPAERLIKFQNEIGNKFILIYCDNFLPYAEEVFLQNFSDYKYRFILNKRSEGNIKIVGKNRIEFINSERNSTYQFVELGYIGVNDEDFFKILIKLKSLSLLFEYVSSINEIEYVIYREDYVSISKLEVYLKNINLNRIILLDRDGIINKSVGHRKYLNNFNDVKIVDENLDFLQKLSKIDFSFIIITNQPGIATGQVNKKFLKKYHQKLLLQCVLNGINLLGIYVCPHHWNEGCICRKPKPGLILQAISQFKLENRNIAFIGDENKDLEAANAANIKGILVNENLGDEGNYGLISKSANLIENIYDVKLN